MIVIAADTSVYLTVITTKSCDVSSPSDTVRYIPRRLSPFGTVTVTEEPDASDSMFVGPIITLHSYVSVSPSGSVDAAPLSVILSPALAVRSIPALAVGARLGCFTVMVTVSVFERTPSDMVSSNVMVASLFGAVNVGDCAVTSESFTPVSDVSFHTYDVSSLSGSVDAEPSRVTVSPNRTVRSAPASDTGGLFNTVMVTVSVDVSYPSDIVSSNVHIPALSGAVNVGFGIVLSESVTAVPVVWFHMYDIISPSWSLDAEPSSVVLSNDPQYFSSGRWHRIGYKKIDMGPVHSIVSCRYDAPLGCG